MQRSSFGMSYNASAKMIERTPTGETGIFMGKPYACQQFNVAGRR